MRVMSPAGPLFTEAERDIVNTQGLFPRAVFGSDLALERDGESRDSAAIQRALSRICG
jgi:hypothetical protein